MTPEQESGTPEAGRQLPPGQSPEVPLAQNGASHSKGLSVGGWLMILGLVPAVAFGVIALLTLSTAGSNPWQVVVGGLAALLAILGLLVFAVGLALYVLLPTASVERARRDYGTHRLALATFALAVIVSYAAITAYLLASGQIATSGEGQGVLGATALTVTIATMELVFLGLVYLRIVRPGVTSWRDMGLTTSKLGRNIVVGIVATVVLMAIVLGLEIALAALGIQSTQAAAFEGMRTASALQFAGVVLAGSVLTALAEEVFFRGYVFRAYLSRKGVWRAFIYSATLFSLAHVDQTLNVATLLPAFVMGLGLAFVYRRTGNLVPGIFVHCVNNAIAFGVLYFAVP